MANYIKYQDFDIEKLRLCEVKTNKSHGFQTMGIKYEYPDGETIGLRLRSPALFSHGFRKYKKWSDYYMPLKSFYDEENPSAKEIEFKETLDSISKFLREKAKEKFSPKKTKKKRDDDFEELEIINNDIFFPKLKLDKISGEIGTIFYEKNEKGNLEKVKDPLSLEEIKCEVVAYIDIEDIFNGSTLKVRMSLSDVAFIKKNVTPKNYEKSFVTPSTEVTLGSDDEEE